MTIAEKVRSQVRLTYPSAADFLKWIQSVDAKALVNADDLGVVITFSDGSFYRMK